MRYKLLCNFEVGNVLVAWRYVSLVVKTVHAPKPGHWVSSPLPSRRQAKLFCTPENTPPATLAPVPHPLRPEPPPLWSPALLCLCPAALPKTQSFFLLLLLLLFILLYFTQCQCTFLSSSHFMPTCLSSYLGFKSLVDFQKFSPNPLPVLNIVMHSRCQLVVQLRSPKPSVATILKLHGEIMSNNTEQSYFLTSYPFPPLKQVLDEKRAQ